MSKEKRILTTRQGEAIERGDFPEWELQAQLMPDAEHPELDGMT